MSEVSFDSPVGSIIDKGPSSAILALSFFTVTSHKDASR
jgi:hypothetical protein